MKSKLNSDSIREKHKAKKIDEQAYIRTSYFQSFNLWLPDNSMKH